ncbi:MAG: DNA methyltransferase [candidate division WOR-3 bacterium]
MYKKGRLKIEDDKLLILLDKKIIGSNWTDITGYTSYWRFNTENSEKMLKRVIELTSNKNDLVLDYFVGIGSSIAVAHKLSRKWIGIDMGEQFYRYETDKGPSGILVRMKEVLAAKGNHEPIGISKDLNWQGGGFFKYYELEQYEEALANCKYDDGDLFNSPLIKGWTAEGRTGYWSDKSPYQEYVFMKDEKMLKALEIDYENDKVKVDLDKLYPNIDIAETLSNLTGKWIKRIIPRQASPDTPLEKGNVNHQASPDATLEKGNMHQQTSSNNNLNKVNYEVEFEDGTKINTEDLDYKLIKPLIWWE